MCLLTAFGANVNGNELTRLQTRTSAQTIKAPSNIPPAAMLDGSYPGLKTNCRGSASTWHCVCAQRVTTENSQSNARS